MSEADLSRESDERSPDERRSPHVQRVDLTTLVDICVQDGKLSPFQGESANVSGRGMQVRTSYLPEIGEELVCRFEHAGQEILVEGRVAWRAEGEDSGEFGIQFTALDASSAQILTDLGEREPGPRFSSIPPSNAVDATKKARSSAARLFSLEDEEEEEESLQPGSRVRLHIDGLGAPMKAAVHDGSRRKVKVGSSLEFLKVGRPLQIEDVQGGQTRGAHVDSVNVVLNPSTSIPELVVMLRYEGMTPTPAPTAARESVRPGAARPSAASQPKKAAPRAADDEAHDAFGDDDEPLVPEAVRPAAEAIRAQWLAASSTAQDVGKKVGSALGSAWDAAREQMNKVAERRRTTAPAPPKQSSVAARPDAARRRTTSPPSHLRSSLSDAGLRSSRPSMRPTSTGVKAPPAAAPRAGRLMVLSGGAIVLFAGSALLLRSLGGSAETPTTSAETPLAAQTAASGAPAPVTPAVAAAPAAPTAAVSPDGIVADVPLFGPKAMATSEAARPSSPTDDATAEKLAAAATVEDEAFAEEPEAPKASEASWGRGRLHLPTIHRIRLDGEGTEVVGALESNGFTVVVPGRKPMESGRSIEKRDRRIVQVKASSTARGASVHFEFRGPVPGYRVRLRKDFVEILVSAPEDGVAAR